MLLNKHNVELCSSLDIGYDCYGHKLKWRIDKLTSVSRYDDEREHAINYRLGRIAKKSWKDYRVRLDYVRCKAGEKVKPYRKALLIFGKEPGSPMLLRIDYEPINSNTGDIRFDLRPQHLTATELDHLFLWLGRRLGPLFPRLLARAWITQVDVALDIYGCQLKDYILGLYRAGINEDYDTPDGLPGVRIGSTNSALHVLCYEKVDATGQTKNSFKRKGDLLELELELDQYPRFLRVEMRYKPLAKPTHVVGNALMLADLQLMKNPFERLQVYSKDLVEVLLMEQLITKKPKDDSLLALKQQINLCQNTNRISKKIESLIKQYEVVLFDIHTLWQNWPACVERLGSQIIPPVAELSVNKRKDRNSSKRVERESRRDNKREKQYKRRSSPRN